MYEIVAPLHRPEHPKTNHIRRELAKDTIVEENPRVKKEDIDVVYKGSLGETKYSDCEIMEYVMGIPAR
ncbi:MAG: hypothetical protein ABEI78_01205, partial [Candidatus Nanohaloarchaea archaeon]